MSQQEKTTDEIIDELMENIKSQIQVLEKDLRQLKRLKQDDDKEFKEWFFGGGSGSPRGFAFGGGGVGARGFTGGGGAGARGFYGFIDGGGSHVGNGFYGLFGGFSVGNNVAEGGSNTSDGKTDGGGAVGNG